MPIIRKLLTELEATDPCNCPEKQFQLNDAGQVVESTDGGLTYTLSSDDPRNDIVEIPPPSIGSSFTKCDAAHNVVSNMQDKMNQYANNLERGKTLTELAGVILLIVFAFLEVTIIGALLTPLLIEIAAALIAITETAFRDYFTTEVWDAVLCAVVCAIGDDATFQDSEVVTLINGLRSNVPGGAGKNILINTFRLAGRAQLNNFAHTGDATGLTCDCSCPCADHFSAATGIRLDTPYYEGYVSFKSVLVPDIGNQLIVQSANKDTCCIVLDVKFDLVGNTGGGFTPFSGQVWLCGTDWTADPGNHTMAGSCMSRTIWAVHPTINPGDVFVMSVLWAEC